MEKREEFNLTKRTQAKASNLRPVMHIEGNNYICCTEVYQPKRQVSCEGFTRYSPIPPMHCLSKNKPCPQTRLRPSGIHERDILFRPIRWRCEKPTKIREKDYKQSLGSPIGLSKSSFSMNFLEPNSSKQSLQGFATILVAFAEYFITPEIEWDENVINRILLEGQRHYVDSKTGLAESDPVKETTIKRNLILCQNTFDVYVDDPFLIGHAIGKELPVPNLHWGLLKFFKKFQFCLLQLDNWYILLWQNADVYFIFDCFGRRTQDFRSDQKHGIAMLICLRSLDNISHLVMNLSGIQPDQVFTMRHLQLKSLIPCGGQPLPDIVDRSIQFKLVSPDYALLRGTIHLGSKCFKEIKHRHSLPVALCALINAKIDATPTWDSTVVDKILHLGAHLYKQWTQCDPSLDLGIQDVPNRFELGQFIVRIALNTISECGQWKCTPNYRNSDLSLALKKAFQQGSNLLVQIQGRSYALWKKGAFYYVLDPYSHQCMLGKKIVTASLRMCGTFERLCCNVTQALLELFDESKFLIHLVKILQVENVDKITENRILSNAPCRYLAVTQADCAQEAMSLNESVLCVGYGYASAEESNPIESDSADLDSPGLSQIHLQDYTNLRRVFIEESSEESDEEEEENSDLDAVSVDIPPSDKSDDDDESPGQVGTKAKKTPKNGSEGRREDKTGRETSNAKESRERGQKQSQENLDNDADDETEKTRKKSKKEIEAKEIARAKKENERKEKENKAIQKKEKEKQAREKKEMEKKEKEQQKKAKMERAKLEKDLRQKENKEKEKTEKGKENKEMEKTNKNDKPAKHETENSKHSDKNENPEPKKDQKLDADTDFNKDKREKENNDNNKMRKDDNRSAPPNDREDNADAAGSKDKRSTETDSRGTLSPTKTTFRRQRHQRRKEQDGEGTSSDENQRTSIPVGCKPNCYPGYTEDPQDLAVVGSESGSYESLCSLLKSAFRCADRVLTMTPWGNYVAFHSNRVYLVFDGCTCNLQSIRHLDLSVGTAGLLCFRDMHSLIKYIESGRDLQRPTMPSKRDIINRICNEYCNRGNK